MTDQVKIDEALDETQELEQDVGSNICITEALVEEVGMEMEVAHALVTLCAVLEVHEFLREADKAQLIHWG